MEERLNDIRESMSRTGKSCDLFIVREQVVDRKPPDIKALEEKHSAKLVEGEIRDGVATFLMMPIHRVDRIVPLVNVWNCQASLAVEEPLQNGYTVRHVPVPEGLQDRFDRLADKIIYREHGGAINWSGQYYPKTAESARGLKRIIDEARKREAKRETT